ncbi:MAG: hypothetical protein KME60_10950 [Cyanomargarita calcarea GSE-NOS-MK-12-04C]|jgi:hypothetical protein|uniref:RiboL-PSP-HEPN domain-containing protein n=1 Tax=Cyanomargarita calcarea GSE-NOS-MK-12-04C TaxID=2839659 RepID=A0A951QLH9_9CYAN|nr:hypothetical protein [Cyanomargarita calcarea GSE-NOS-MK-12-04C]
MITNLDAVAEKIVDELLANTGFRFALDLMDDDTIASLISYSGSIGWGLDTYEIIEAWFVEPEKISFSTGVYLDGTPDDETSILGTSILAKIQGEVIQEDEKWEIFDYEVLEADFYPPNDNDYDEYYSSVILSNTDFYGTFLESLEKIEALLYAEVPVINQENTVDVRQYLFRLLYINVITVLETFLSDAFINTVLQKRVLIRKFVESNPEFAKQKFSLQELFSTVDKIDDEVKKYLSSQMWHNLKKVKPMYKATLDIEFPEDLKKFFKAIDVRHDLVHRNGKSKSGEEIILTPENMKELVADIRKLVDYIHNQFGNNNMNTFGS